MQNHCGSGFGNRNSPVILMCMSGSTVMSSAGAVIFIARATSTRIFGMNRIIFSLENSEPLLEFHTISRWLHCFVADSLQTESSTVQSIQPGKLHPPPGTTVRLLLHGGKGAGGHRSGLPAHREGAEMSQIAATRARRRPRVEMTEEQKQEIRCA